MCNDFVELLIKFFLVFDILVPDVSQDLVFSLNELQVLLLELLHNCSLNFFNLLLLKSLSFSFSDPLFLLQLLPAL